MNETVMKTVWSKLPKPSRETVKRLHAMAQPAPKLTKREQYVADHPNMSWEQLARDCGTCIYAMQKAYISMSRKNRLAYEQTGHRLVAWDY